MPNQFARRGSPPLRKAAQHPLPGHAPPSPLQLHCDSEGILRLHLPQVRLVARSIWGRVRFAVELDDLIGFGVIGLLNAMERFDPNRGTLLKTYAEHRIRGAILDGLRTMDWLPRSARQRERQRQESEKTNSHARYFSLRSAAPPPEPVLQAVPTQRVRRPVTRIEVVFAGGSLSDLERLAEGTGAGLPSAAGDSSPEALYERKEQRVRLAGAVDRLPRRHREIIELYYHHELSMKQIGQRMSIHESRVSQLHAAAIQRLRLYLSAGPQPASPFADLRSPLGVSAPLAGSIL